MKDFIKYLILFLMLLFCSSYADDYYKNVVPGLPIGAGKRLGGVYKKVTPKCSHKQSPIDLTKEKMQVDAYDRISKGISVFVIAFIVSIAFANPLTNKIADIVMGVGGLLFILGITKLFVATYLTWIVIGVSILLLIIIIYRLRGRSVLRCTKWFKSLKSS